jgi:hypothetical protein
VKHDDLEQSSPRALDDREASATLLRGLTFTKERQLAKVPRANHPAISRTRAGALPFCISAAAWVDLLGYGSMIGETSLNPIDARAEEAVVRLRAFHRIVAEHSGRYFRTLVINDGAVSYRDLSLRDNGVTHHFLQRSRNLFEAIADSEERNGWPGARMVLGLGFRARGSRRAIDDAEQRVDRILARMAAGDISAEEAVRQAASIQRYSDVLPQLQANFAFTRAYVADSGGSRVGLGGPRMFVDAAMFIDSSPPSWVECGALIPFEDQRLQIGCSFVPVSGLNPPGKIGDRIPGLRDGLEIGEAIAPTIALRQLIRASR